MKHNGPRLILDLLMSSMLVFEMLYSLTGNMLHELVGALFFATLIAHIVLSRKWFSGVRAKARAKRNLTGKQKAKLAMAIVLGIACIILLVSSVLISNLLSGFTGLQLGFGAYSWWAYAHTVCAYAVCAFAICHIGLHWVGVFRALRIPYSAERRNAINVGVMSVAAIGVAALGATAVRALGPLSPEAFDMQGDDSKSGASAGESGRNELRSIPESEAQSDDPDIGSGGSRGKGSRGYQRNQGSGHGSGSGSNTGRSFDEKSPAGDESDSGSGSRDSGNSSSGSTSSICTLCSKRCLLSSPRCNKPYVAGLI